jgi:hypothetical protein
LFTTQVHRAQGAVLAGVIAGMTTFADRAFHK